MRYQKLSIGTNLTEPGDWLEYYPVLSFYLFVIHCHFGFWVSLVANTCSMGDISAEFSIAVIASGNSVALWDSILLPSTFATSL